MSERFPSVSAKDVVRVLQRAGFAFQRQKGSHVTLRDPESRRTVVVPMHTGDIKRPLLKAILQQAELGEDEFRSLL
jgi:predicted RNA binding protein YcfA (HicA-like mRNA interferase family)